MTLELLHDLSTLGGISGDESAIRKRLSQALQDRSDAIAVDSMGNLIARKKAGGGSESRPLRIMLAAHMDEVGLMLSSIQGDGSLAFEAVGGIDPRILIGQVVRVGPDEVKGTIGIIPPHLAKGATAPPAIDALRVDIGVDSKDAAAGLVSPGDSIVFDSQCMDLGPSLLGKAFDDRAGCAVISEALADDYPNDIFATFTVQEEIGLRGARVAAHRIKPDLAIVLECGTTDDGPKEIDDTPVMQMGKGPAIT